MRERAGLDLGDMDDFAPERTIRSATKREPTVDTKVVAAQAAAQEGFTARSGSQPKIDGRTLKRTGRIAQLNISVKPETRYLFWKAAQKAGFPNGEEFLLHLLGRSDAQHVLTDSF